MRKINQLHVGIKEKGSNKIIAVYPEIVTGNFDEIEQKVRDWFYMSSCGAEDTLNNCYIDIITEKE